MVSDRSDRSGRLHSHCYSLCLDAGWKAWSRFWSKMDMTLLCKQHTSKIWSDSSNSTESPINSSYSCGKLQTRESRNVLYHSSCLTPYLRPVPVCLMPSQIFWPSPNSAIHAQSTWKRAGARLSELLITPSPSQFTSWPWKTSALSLDTRTWYWLLGSTTMLTALI